MHLTIQQETLARFLIWQIGIFVENSQIENPPVLYTTLHAEGLAITKLKIRQCIPRISSPILMLIKVSLYTSPNSQ